MEVNLYLIARDRLTCLCGLIWTCGLSGLSVDFSKSCPTVHWVLTTHLIAFNRFQLTLQTIDHILHYVCLFTLNLFFDFQFISVQQSNHGEYCGNRVVEGGGVVDHSHPQFLFRVISGFCY